MRTADRYSALRLEKKLLLFDIDGTLIASGGAGVAALRLGVKETFGSDAELDGVEIEGRTDSGIARQVLAKMNLPASPENLTAFFDGYLRHLGGQLAAREGQLLPGIARLLEALKARSDVVLALLTGNLARGAEIKLTHYGVWQYFDFGAYADDHHDRNELGPFARTRAHERHGVAFAPERIFILGDTPHDIACARAIGAKAVAVASGRFTSGQLAAFAPDYLFEDFSDLPAVLAIFD